MRLVQDADILVTDDIRYSAYNLVSVSEFEHTNLESANSLNYLNLFVSSDQEPLPLPPSSK
jgi:hypothetical protein